MFTLRFDDEFVKAADKIGAINECELVIEIEPLDVTVDVAGVESFTSCVLEPFAVVESFASGVV
jgi:hypothetical protein